MNSYVIKHYRPLSLRHFYNLLSSFDGALFRVLIWRYFRYSCFQIPIPRICRKHSRNRCRIESWLPSVNTCYFTTTIAYVEHEASECALPLFGVISPRTLPMRINTLCSSVDRGRRDVNVYWSWRMTASNDAVDFLHRTEASAWHIKRR